jgi:phage recombination protein Bet
MAQQARQTTAVTVSRLPPANYKGTAQSWKVLTDAIWPGARSAESIMLALAYCASRNLDPFKRPVHIVPVYNSALRREVETVWPGISELLTVAARSREFAGVDEPREGPEETRTFEGTDREGKPISKTITFPLWASVTVYRMVGGVRVAFSAPVYWLEAYARQTFRSTVPNDMWAKRPHGQLHKCALAAALRLGFPEDVGSDYAAEEMEGREVASGGVIIDQEPVENSPNQQEPKAEPERQHTPGPPEALDGTSGEPDPLDEQNGTVWLKNLDGLLSRAASEAEVVAIGGHQRVRASLETAPALIVDRINAMLRQAHDRVRPPAEEEWQLPQQSEWPDDPILDHLTEIDAASLDELEAITDPAAWRTRVDGMFPPDVDRLREAIDLRRAILKERTA